MTNREKLATLKIISAWLLKKIAEVEADIKPLRDGEVYNPEWVEDCGREGISGIEYAIMDDPEDIVDDPDDPEQCNNEPTD